jgi:4-amino-4-deoxy-L-arabinose transferase-like glycosyltransferase
LALVSRFLALACCFLFLSSFCSQRRRDAKKSNREQLYLLSLVSRFLSFAFFFFLLFARKDAKKSNREQLCLLLLGSWLFSLGSFFFLLAKVQRRKEI